MSLLTNDIASNLTFSWQGALTAFIAFEACIGLPIAKKTYIAWFENADPYPASNARAAGAGHALNYTIQFLIATLGGGFATGTTEIITDSTSNLATLVERCR